MTTTPDSRPSRDAILMAVAQLYSQRSTCRRNQVGAVIGRDGRALSTGYNGAPSGLPHCSQANCDLGQPCTRTVHAEQGAIAHAARLGIATEGATLYTTVSPCQDCAKLIINAGIKRVIYAEAYRDQGPVSYLRLSGIEVYSLLEVPDS